MLGSLIALPFRKNKNHIALASGFVLAMILVSVAIYQINEVMKNREIIAFDSGEGARVSLFFVDVENIEESIETLYVKLIKTSNRRDTDEHKV